MKSFDPTRYANHTKGPWSFSSRTLFLCGRNRNCPSINEPILDCFLINEGILDHVRVQEAEKPLAVMKANIALIEDSPELLQYVIKLKEALELAWVENQNMQTFTTKGKMRECLDRQTGILRGMVK